MREMPPDSAAAELARWLLAAGDRAHTTPQEQTIAAAQIYERLRGTLATYLGGQGFDALWARALQLVRRTAPWDGASVESGDPVAPHGLDIAARGRDAAAAQAVLLAILAQFLELLFTFIGADLGLRLLRQCWPALPDPTVHTHSGEPQP